MQATVYNLAGEEVETIDLDEAIFGVTPNMAVIHQAVLRQQANARQGTSSTKTRADVSGGGRKPWRQKGTGRARQGSTRSPQWRHGGVVFGPHPRSYEQDMPRKMRRLAIRGVLSAKAADGRIVLVDSFEELEPRTKAMSEALGKLNVGENSALIMTSEQHENLEKAAHNLPKVTTMSAHFLSIVDMLKHEYIVMPRASLDIIRSILDNTGGRRSLPLHGVPQTDGIATEQKAEAKTKPTGKAEAAKEPAKVAREGTLVAQGPTKTRRAKAEIASEEAVQEAVTEEPKTRRKAAGKAGKSVVFGNVHYSGEEYVELKNTGETAVDLGGWVLRDKNDTGQSYRFPEGAELVAGKALKVYTKPGHKYSFESNRPVWNDKGDQLELLDASDAVVDTYSYGTYAEASEDTAAKSKGAAKKKSEG